MKFVSKLLPCLCAAFALLLFGLLACSDGGGESNATANVELLREKAAGLWIENRRSDALEVLEPLVAGESPEYIDALNVGILHFALSESAKSQTDKKHYTSEALRLLGLAASLRPEDPAPVYNLGVMCRRKGELELAEEYLAKAHELAPDDYQTQLHYANALSDLDKEAEALKNYRELVDRGVDVGQGLYVSAVYRLGRSLNWSGREGGMEFLLEYKRLGETGLEIPSDEAQRIGEFGRITWPRPTATSIENVPAPYSSSGRSVPLPPELAGMSGLRAWTVAENWERIDVEKQKGEEDEAEALFAPTQAPKATEVGLPDLGGWGPNGLVIALRQPDGSFVAHSLTTDSVRLARAFDLDNDGDLDFLAVTADGVRIYETQRAGEAITWSLFDAPLPKLPTVPTDVQPVDFDHEGDLDLLLVGEFGARLWRNDGFSVTQRVEEERARKNALKKKGDEVKELEIEPASWFDATAESGLPMERAFDWCLIEDFDTDQDVDLLLGGKQGAFLVDNLRAGVFGDASQNLSAVAPHLGKRPLVADLNGDAWPDFWIASLDGAHLFLRQASGQYVGAEAGGAPTDKITRLGQVDLNGDGYLDATWTREGGGAGYALSIGAGSRTPASVALFQGARATTWDDFDGDGAIDALVSYPDRAELVPGVRTSKQNTIRLAILAKQRDNRRGVGSIVELRAGPIYRRIYWNGEPITLGLGQQSAADILRITWPRGVEQHDFDVAAGSRWSMLRVDRIEGSCPFLYTWNGEQYEFITDVLGITPLGLPMAPGMLVPPDHDEYVLVRGEQMQPRVDEDGSSFFDLQFTEELREVTYLDRIRLEVVDHPEGTEVFPNERFSFPPFPEAHTHVMRDPLVPTRATDHRGEDWTSQVAAIDGDYAIPFEAYKGLLTGLAKPHTLELEFDSAAVADAKLLRLVCTGWFLWSDASINMAAARTPGVDFIPPILQVPDASAEGGWRSVGPPVGFPAGKRKTMVLDVTEFIDRADPRIRLFGTLCLYWDAIRLATDDDDEPLIVTHVEPASAELWQRGFSRSSHPLPGHMLEWFDWNELDEARWNQHPGSYTKLGQVLPLLVAIEDQYVIMGAGDALNVRFPADALPELEPGWRRDYLVFLDGWAKDRDPNTLEALYVEPLPFHGMSGYPYRADESFPDTAAHRAWRREWNTRPSTRWIEELAPGRNPEVALW